MVIIDVLNKTSLEYKNKGNLYKYKKTYHLHYYNRCLQLYGKIEKKIYLKTSSWENFA